MLVFMVLKLIEFSGQSLQAVAIAPASRYFPAGQASYNPGPLLLLYVPRLHGKHSLPWSPSPKYPATQEQFNGLLLPVVLEFEYMVQEVQNELPRVCAYFPCGQGMQMFDCQS